VAQEKTQRDPEINLPEVPGPGWIGCSGADLGGGWDLGPGLVSLLSCAAGAAVSCRHMRIRTTRDTKSGRSYRLDTYSQESLMRVPA
jgi:hypothetical protein